MQRNYFVIIMFNKSYKKQNILIQLCITPTQLRSQFSKQKAIHRIHYIRISLQHGSSCHLLPHYLKKILDLLQYTANKNRTLSEIVGSKSQDDVLPLQQY